MERAAGLLAEGNARLACHLIEFAVLAEPMSAAVHEVRRAIYEARSREQVSSMARNILNHPARASAEGRRDLAGAA